MAPPLVVDPEALFAVGSAAVTAGEGLAANLTVLTSGFAAHTGLDAAGTLFGLAYQDAAESLLKAVAAAINACRHSGALIQQGASNYSKAEAASTLGGGAGALQAPPEPAKISAPGPPGTWGKGEPPPLLWAVVESFVDDLWPDGDVAGLHGAAARWRGFAGGAGGMRSALNSAKSLLDAHQIPEGEKIDQALSQIGDCIAKIGEASGKLATALDDFANEVDQAHQHIRDLLHRLGSLSDLGHDLMLIIKGDALDEIKKIARDINGVLHDLGREARAAEQQIKLGMQIVDGLIVKFEKWTRGELTQFLGDEVGNPVATVFDTWVNTNEGVLKGAVGTVLAIGDLDPRWFLLDPKGTAATWSDMGKSMWKGSLINAFLNPQEATDANLQMFKSLLHLDDWSTARPGLGFGENLFDAAMFFIPGGGEAGAAADGAGAAARGAEAAAGAMERAGPKAVEGLEGLASARSALADVAKTSGDLTKGLEGVAEKLPKIDPPGGRPVGLPAPKPLDAPVETAPHPPDMAQGQPHGPGAGRHDPVGGPHEPVGGPHEPAAEPTPAPAVGGPHEPVSAPVGGPHLASVPAAAGERMPSAVPQLVEHSPAQVPISHSGSPIGPAPIAAHPSPPASSFSAAAPHFTPPAVRPLEMPAPAGGWHGAGDGGPPGGRPHGRPPHGGDPYGLSDGDRTNGHPDHPSSDDGTPHGPGAADGPTGDDLSGGLSADMRDEIIAMPKGSRPDPSQYLSSEYIERHLSKFSDGATRFMPESNLEKYGIAQRDGSSFVMPKGEADAMIAAASGDLRVMENELGLPEGFLDSNKIIRIDIADPEEFNLRIPSGNEAGANDQWIPGGHLPNGSSEAVVDGEKIPTDDYTVTDVFK